MLLSSYCVQLCIWLYLTKSRLPFKVYFYEATNIGITGAVEQIEISPHYWIFPLSQLADSHYD